MRLDEAIRTELVRLEQTKTFKKETVIESEQGALVRVAGKDVVMLASNNYLGLASHPRIKEAAMRGVREFGFGVSSVRFLCGTLTVHRQLEEKIAQFLGTEDAILFSSCFAANEGFFASITNEKLGTDQYRDVIYSDRLNHASIIDGTRLCRPKWQIAKFTSTPMSMISATNSKPIGRQATGSVLSQRMAYSAWKAIWRRFPL